MHHNLKEGLEEGLDCLFLLLPTLDSGVSLDEAWQTPYLSKRTLLGIAIFSIKRHKLHQGIRIFWIFMSLRAAKPEDDPKFHGEIIAKSSILHKIPD
jgi:hypothetical protein